MGPRPQGLCSFQPEGDARSGRVVVGAGAPDAGHARRQHALAIEGWFENVRPLTEREKMLIREAVLRARTRRPSRLGVNVWIDNLKYDDALIRLAQEPTVNIEGAVGRGLQGRSWRQDDPARPRGRGSSTCGRPQPDARRSRKEAARPPRQAWASPMSKWNVGRL